MAKIQGINAVKPEHDKNYIINGDMRIAQRGTSFPAIAGSTYSLDRYTNINNTSAVFTITQDSDVPTAIQAGYFFQNSLKIDVTTADAAVAAGDRVQIRQVIEGYNWADIAQKKFTLSFWVKATKTGTYCVSLVNNGSDRSYVAEYTINSTLTWERKTITIAASPSAGGWNYTNSVGIVLSWTLMAGTNFNTTPGAWQTGNLHSTSNQVNSMDSVSNDFWLTGVMVNEGAVAAPFKLFGEDFDQEFEQCRRYYMRLNSSAEREAYAVGQAINTSDVNIVFSFPKNMRANPTVGFQSATALGLSNSAGANASSSTIDTAVSRREGLRLRAVRTGSGLTAGDAVRVTLDEWMELSAEL